MRSSLASPRSPSSTSSRTQRPGVAEREALAGRRRAARRRHRRHLDPEHPAPRVGQRRGRADHRRSCSARRSLTRSCARRPDRARRHDARGAAPAQAHGNIYPAERIDAALGNYFRPGNLGALRELALLWVADRVDEALDEYRRLPRHRATVGDTRAGARGPYGRSGRRPARHGRPDGAAGEGRPRRGARRSQDGLAPPPGGAGRSADARRAPRRHVSRRRRRRHRQGASRHGATHECDPDRPWRDPRVALDRVVRAR